MLPPVDSRVLERNPNFEVLYKDLTTRKLNTNGSTRDTKKQRIHDEMQRSIDGFVLTVRSNHVMMYLEMIARINRELTKTQSLTIARTNFISSQILITSLSELPSRATDLPPELHSVIEIVTAQLNGHVPDSDREILSADVDFFFDNITTISDALSTQIIIIVEYLCKIADPKSPPAISNLSYNAAELQTSAMQSLPQDISISLTDLTTTLTTLLSTHLTLLTTSIRILEQTQHGALARHAKSSAELLHTRATVLGLQAKIHTFAHPPPAEFVAALKEFKKQQGSGEKALRDREALARRALELYLRAGEKGMKDLARRKDYLLNETRGIEEEIAKLEAEA